MNKHILYSLLTALIVLYSCDNENNSDLDFRLIDESTPEIVDRKDNIEAIYFNVPSPMETTIILKKSGAIYDYK